MVSRTLLRMKIVVAGASGMIGSALVPVLVAAGHDVVRVGRRAGPGFAVWDVAAGTLDPAVIEGATAVVNLAGAGIADGRWTAARRAEILDSRVAGTRLLVDTMGKVRERPAVFVCASGVGYYGVGDEQAFDETSPAGGGFLATVCQHWEVEARCAEALGVRVAPVRLGVVLSTAGGALKKLLPVFRAGVGGPAGSGRQWMSWIAIDDVVGAILHVIGNSSIAGPVNLVTPHAVRNAEFAQTLGRVLGRPAAVRAPATMLRLMFGAMAEETVLASSLVTPTRLTASGYSFRFPRIDEALSRLIAH